MTGQTIAHYQIAGELGVGGMGTVYLWGQRLESASRRPVGEAFAVQHLLGRVSYQRLAGSRRMMSRAGAR